MAPLPTFAGQSAPGYSNIGGWNLYINPHSKNVAADLTFIKWMSSTQAQDVLSIQYSEIPTVQSVRTSPQVLALNPVLATVPKTRLVPRPAGTPNYPQLSTAIYQNVNAALSGSSSPSAAMAAAQSAAQHGLVQLGRRLVTGPPMPRASRLAVRPAGPGRPSVLRRSHELAEANSYPARRGDQ